MLNRGDCNNLTNACQSKTAGNLTRTRGRCIYLVFPISPQGHPMFQDLPRPGGQAAGRQVRPDGRSIRRPVSRCKDLCGSKRERLGHMAVRKTHGRARLRTRLRRGKPRPAVAPGLKSESTFLETALAAGGQPDYHRGHPAAGAGCHGLLVKPCLPLARHGLRATRGTLGRGVVVK